MTISELSIRRPVLATVINLIILLVGLVAYERLTIREYPNIDVPVVNVTTKYPGANAQIIESQVTTLLEESLAGIEGVDVLSSISRAESSQITVRFSLDREADAAASDVRDRVGRVRGKLPREIDEPVVAKVEADAQPILILTFSSDKHSPLEVTEIADQLVKDRLQTLPGVASIRIYGERRYAMRIWLDPMRLAAYQLTIQDIENALREQNVEIPSGRIESFQREFTVLSESDLNTPEQFSEIILATTSNYLVRLKDVARVELGAENERLITRFNGDPAVALGVIKQSTANPLEVSKAVEAILPEVLATLPDGMKGRMATNSTEFIQASIDGVYTTIVEAIVLVVLVIFFFLRKVRATLIPLVTIPVSLVGACIFMMIFGFSINTLTLLAMVLAIGLVVDDAIVMLENIHRHIEEGMPPYQAALKGSREISFAVIAMTITLAAVFVPVAFAEGRTGKLFSEFALTLAGAVLVSGVVALTLSPMMCSVMLRPENKNDEGPSRFEAGFQWVMDSYKKLLASVVDKQIIAFFLLCISSVIIYGVLMGLPGLPPIGKELAPLEDRGYFMGIAIAPDGSTPAYVDKYAKEMEAYYAEVEEVERMFMIIGYPDSTGALSFVGLHPWEERERSQMEITAMLRGQFYSIPGFMAFPTNPQSLGQRRAGTPVQFILQSTGSYEDLEGYVGQVMEKLAGYPGLTNVIPNIKLNKPELKVEINREKAANIGVDVDDIGRTLESLLGGRKVTRFKRGSEQYDVMVQLEKEDRSLPQDLAALYVRNDSGQMIQLSNLVEVTETVTASELNHFNKTRSAQINAGLGDGYSMGEVLTFMENAVKEINDAKLNYDFNGPSREYKVSSNTLFVTFILALGFIYLVLAAQFESFIDPFVILLSVPLALAGALLALQYSGGTLNIFSQIGLITLIGLISKHGILIVEFANQAQLAGMNKLESAVEAAAMRLRPILMTTGAMVLGAIPLALADGPGAESRQQIGWVVVGGLVYGSILTLFVLPSLYALIAREKKPEAELDAAVAA